MSIDNENKHHRKCDTAFETKYTDILVESETDLVPPALYESNHDLDIHRKIKVKVLKKVANVAVIDGVLYKTICYKALDCKGHVIDAVLEDEVPFKALIECPCNIDIKDIEVEACILDTVFHELKNICGYHSSKCKKVSFKESESVLIRIAILNKLV